MTQILHIDEGTSRRGSGEALARLRAEGALIRKHDGEYRKFLRRGDHVTAVRDLVKKRAVEYGTLVREWRDRVRADRAEEAAA